MLRLRPYKACDAWAVAKWIKTEHSLHQWCANRYDKFPLTPDDMNLYHDADKYCDQTWAMTAFDDEGIVGHLTMRFPLEDDKSEVRLGFVIIDDQKRRKGYGRQMITMSCKYAFEFLGAKKISLWVFENNIPARKCYASCGFKEVDDNESKTYSCMGEKWKILKMEMTEHDLKKNT